MPYAISRKDRTAIDTVRRVAAERAEASLKALADDRLAPEKRIHEIRKNTKKIRALLRLVRPVFAAFAKENAALRDAARGVSGLRDNDVIRATLEDLASMANAGPDATRRALALAGADDPAAPRDHDKALGSFADAMTALLRRAPSWQIEPVGFDAFRPGLERTWTHARRAAKAAARDHGHDAVHEWRKRVKDHWYHATILAPVWPAMMAPHVEAADDLGETLGRCGDLAMVIARLAAGAEDELAHRLSSLAHEQRQLNLAAARALHGRLFAEPADCIADRWEAWWDAWRAET